MSQGDAAAAEIISEYAGLITNAYCAMGASTFLCYEFAITYSEEVELFWKRGFSGASALFFCNRYLVLVVNILNLVGYATLSAHSCSLLARAAFTMLCLQYMIWAAFSGLRTFALSKNYAIALLVSLLSTVSVGINLTDFHFDVDGVNIPVLGCTATTNMATAMLRKYVIIDRSCLIAADIIIIYVTWSTLGRKGFSVTSRGSFVGVLLRDGTAYFIVLVILNVLHLVFTLLAIDTPLQSASNVSAFTESVTATLVSRFLIHIQAANRRTMHIDTHSSFGGARYSKDGRPTVGTLVFNRVVGPMDSTLSYDEDRGDAEDAVDGTSEENRNRELRPSGEHARINVEPAVGYAV